MYLIRTVTSQLAQDRGFTVFEQELNQDFSDWAAQIPIFGEKYTDYSLSEGGLTFQQTFNNLANEKRIITLPAYLQQLYWNSDYSDNLGVFIIDEENTSVNTARFIVNIISLFKINNVVVVKNKDSSYARAVLDSIHGLTEFLSSELMINPSKNVYTPKYIKPDQESLRKFIRDREHKTSIPNRFSNDVLIRYYGFISGDLLIEYYPEIALSNSFLTEDLYWVRVIDPPNRK